MKKMLKLLEQIGLSMKQAFPSGPSVVFGTLYIPQVSFFSVFAVVFSPFLCFEELAERCTNTEA